MAIFTVSKDSQNQWRWAFLANNNRTIAVSSEAYHNREDCLAAIRLLKSQGPASPAYDISAPQPVVVPGV